MLLGSQRKRQETEIILGGAPAWLTERRDTMAEREGGRGGYSAGKVSPNEFGVEYGEVMSNALVIYVS